MLGVEGDWPEIPPGSGHSPSPGVLSQLSAGAARTRGLCSKSKINLEARREVNRVSRSRIAWDPELPAGGGKWGGGRPRLQGQ